MIFKVWDVVWLLTGQKLDILFLIDQSENAEESVE